MVMEREQCRKVSLPDRLHLGHGVNNDMTVIIRWSAIDLYIQRYMRDGVIFRLFSIY